MNLDEVEIWLDIPEYEGYYEVSSLGNIRSTEGRLVKDCHGNTKATQSKMLIQTEQKTGYSLVMLNKLGKRKTMRVHRAVALAFLGSPPLDKELVCHIDGNSLNNKASNLRWDSQSGNMKDRRIHGTDPELNKVNCPRGHKLESPNLRPDKIKIGKRCCLACARTQSRYSNFKRKNRPLDMNLFQQFSDAYYKEIVGEL